MKSTYRILNDPRKLLAAVGEFSCTSNNALQLADVIVENVKQIQTEIGELFPAAAVDIPAGMDVLADKIAKGGIDAVHMNRTIMEICDDLRVVCCAYEVYAAPDPRGTGRTKRLDDNIFD